METNSFSSREKAISISRLQKKYGDLTAVDGLSFDIYQGEIFGFLGPNGAGKTTAINMICGLTATTSGKIDIAGFRHKHLSSIKSYIGICPQENIFWPKLTCREQLLFMAKMYGLPAKTADQRTDELLTNMGLQQKSSVLAGKLSGGMKRRLNICLALVHDPRILILDEPEAGLDPQSRILVRNYIKSLAHEKTIILTTHNMDEADRTADRVAIIDFGKLLLLDTPANLKKSIGAGDVLEIELDGEEGAIKASLINSLAAICDKVEKNGSCLKIRAKNVIESVSEITRIIKNDGLKISATTLRENTLEDVFIYLTGRRLRQ